MKEYEFNNETDSSKSHNTFVVNKDASVEGSFENKFDSIKISKN